jgi:hypothetical protein
MTINLRSRTGLFRSEPIKVTVLNKKGNDEDQNGQGTQVRRVHLCFLGRRSKTRWDKDKYVAVECWVYTYHCKTSKDRQDE